VPAHPPAATRGLVVAVDGPSGSGKSTVSRAVARRLGLAYLDTGAMYRAVCWWCLESGVDLADPDAVARAAREIDLVVGTDPAAATVHVGGEDVTAAVRESRISAAVSAVATNLAVRAELRERQRRLVADLSTPPAPGVVAEGRDLTTVVTPDADVRVLLTAEESARLARRAAELHGHVGEEALAATHDEVVRRDEQDATVSAFRVAADGVVTVDSSALSLEETVAAVLALVEASRPAGQGQDGPARARLHVPTDRPTDQPTDRTVPERP
jgi:CMP/dCMP kinase